MSSSTEAKQNQQSSLFQERDGSIVLDLDWKNCPVRIWGSETIQWHVFFTDDTYLHTVVRKDLALVVGLGKEPTRETLRCAAAKAVKTVRSLGGYNALLYPPTTLEDTFSLQDKLSCLTIGAALALYQPPRWKKASDSPFEVYLSCPAELEPVRAQAAVLSECICLARDLVNLPSNYLTPEVLALAAEHLADSWGMEVEVLDETQAQEEHLEAFLTVGRSAAHPPRFVILRYQGGRPEQPILGLVGKGICTDTGGYSLKAKNSMKGIRGDMAGAAAVLCAITALARLKVPVNVVGVLPLAENRISPDSFLPGDLIGSLSGKTIEISNSDAEGRLILADAITWALQKEKASAVADVATLTGSMASMFGGVTTGYFCTNSAFHQAFLQAAERSGERFWQMPLMPEYRKMVQGTQGDLKNSSDGCGAICAASFLREFTEDAPWIHLDIAGTADTKSPLWEYQAKGGTGICVSTLYELGRVFSRAPDAAAAAAATPVSADS